MSVEARDQQEFQRYLEYQQAQRQHRVETLGGAATMIFLTAIDMSVIGASDPASERRVRQQPESAPETLTVSLRATRERRLAEFAAESAELGHYRAV